MIEDFSEFTIYIKPGATDMRKQINSLASLSETEISDDVFSKKLFIFCNSTKTHLKILYWDRNGFCLWLKRLEKGRFPWPMSEHETNTITYDELKMLLKGIDFFNAHKKLNFSRVT
jgi:transposase